MDQVGDGLAKIHCVVVKLGTFGMTVLEMVVRFGDCRIKQLKAVHKVVLGEDSAGTGRDHEEALVV